jgi:hypothetical protein
MKRTFSIASVILLTCLINTGRGAVISDLEPDLVALWHFDEGSGDITYDSVGAQHGTISGATWIQGKYGSALHFDGSGLVSAGCGCGDITHLLDFTVMA